MFTGLISAIGTIRDVSRAGVNTQLTIASPYTDLALGESVAVNGACLTVAAIIDSGFRVDVVSTTVSRTAISAWRVGHRVNLERALVAGERLGGHLVQGHVDGVGTVDAVTTDEGAHVLTIDVPADIAALCVPRGSLTVDGVSLTVNHLDAAGRVDMSLVPFTLTHTTLGERRAGDPVHLEADILARYVAAQLARQGRE